MSCLCGVHTAPRAHTHSHRGLSMINSFSLSGILGGPEREKGKTRALFSPQLSSLPLLREYSLSIHSRKLDLNEDEDIMSVYDLEKSRNP